jgi:hypothetical protein
MLQYSINYITKLMLGALTVMMLISLFSCEKEITIDLPAPEDLIIVQGSIYQDSIPIVILTRNIPYYGTNDFTASTNLFVKDAIVKVWDDEDTIILSQNSLTIEQDSSEYELVFYANFSSNFKGEVLKTYHLEISAEDKLLTAKTYIPAITNIDSMWWEPKVLDDSTYAQLFCLFEDPDTTGNYYRYFTKRNSEPMYPGFSSVFDDAVVNGTSFEIPITRAYDRNADVDFKTYGLFEIGDTTLFRVCGIDEATYNFWLTLENNSNTGGPYASPVIVNGNIEGQGGLGIWGGYSIEDNYLILQE